MLGESQVAEAFVRIRPNTAGFTQEASTGIGGAAKKLAAVFAAGFIVHKAFDFGKEAVADAALVQKYRETVVQEFGKSGEAIQHFSEGAAAQLGISTQDALQSASAYGILFKNLGIGQKKGADMTIQIEKLAGAMGQLKGQDPATALDALRLSLAGNTRGLKQFGIVADGATIKQQALKMGLIKTTKDAITPAIKAQAIYGIATKHLGEFQAQAAKHSGDLLNQQHVLSAEWVNAKEAIGKALLPAVTTLVGLLSQEMPNIIHLMEEAAKVIQEDLANAFEFVGEQVDAFGSQIEAVQKFISDNSGLISQFGRAFLVAATAIGATALAVAALEFALGLLLSPIVVIAAIAAGLYVLYQRSQTVHDAVQQLVAFIQANVLPVLGQFAQFISKQVSDALAYLRTLGPDAQKALHNLISAFQTVIAIAQDLWRRFGFVIKIEVQTALAVVTAIVKSVMGTLRGVIDVFLGLLSGDWSRAWSGLKEIVGAQVRGALAIFRALLGGFYSLAVSLGSKIYAGIRDGLGDLKGLIEGWVKDALSNLNPFSPVEHGGELYIGAAITRGAIKGLGGLQGAIQDSLRGALAAPGGYGRGVGRPALAGSQNASGAVNVYGPVYVTASSPAGFADELNKMARRVRR